MLLAHGLTVLKSYLITTFDINLRFFLAPSDCHKHHQTKLPNDKGNIVDNAIHTSTKMEQVQRLFHRFDHCLPLMLLQISSCFEFSILLYPYHYHQVL